MNNKKMLIGLGIVAVVGYYLWYMNKKKSSNSTKMAMDTDTTATDTSADATTDGGETSNFADDELLNATGSTRQVKGRFP